MREDNSIPETEEREVGIFRPDDPEKLSETPESITACESSSHNPEYEGLRLEKLPIRGLKSFLYCLLILVILTAGRQLYLLFLSAWETHVALLSILALFTAFLLITSMVLMKELFINNKDSEVTAGLQKMSDKLRNQSTVGGSTKYIKELKDFYNGKPQAQYLSRALGDLADYSNDREAIDHLEKTFLEPLDKEAMRRIANYSAQAGLAVAISPFVAIDMLLALWRCLKMIDDVSQVYGIRPSLPDRLRLIKQVLNLLLLTGASEYIIDQVFDEVGIQTLTGAFKTRVGQGIGIGMYCSRIGLSTMAVTRPILFDESNKPKLRSLMKPLIGELLSLIKKRR